MQFIWPEALFALALLPACLAYYFWMLKRRRQEVVTFPSLLLIKQAMLAQSSWRRHVPPGLLWLALACAVVGLARPVASVVLPADYMTLVLAMDVSRSMLAEDVEPNRIKAAQAAVKDFISELPPNIRVGVVSFAGAAQLVQNVTDQREDLLAAIDRFQLQRGTATGSGLLLALATLLPESGVDIESAVYGKGFGSYMDDGSTSRVGSQGAGSATSLQNKKPLIAPQPVPAGSYGAGAIVLLSDGRRTTGPDPLEAARQAAQRGVRVYTVAFGTANGFIPGFEGSSFYAKVDEETLQAMAKITEGEFFRAGNSGDLKQIYQHLSSKFALEKRDTEVSALLAAASLLLVLLAASLTGWWNRSRLRSTT